MYIRDTWPCLKRYFNPISSFFILWDLFMEMYADFHEQLARWNQNPFYGPSESGHLHRNTYRQTPTL